MLKKLIIFSVISANIGYTLFLFPLLGVLYKDRVPLTFSNLVAFTVADTVGGVLLAVTAYFAVRIAKISVRKSITLSTILLWALYWLTTICAENPSNISSSITVICLDAIAALITWTTLTTLTKHFIDEKPQSTPVNRRESNS